MPAGRPNLKHDVAEHIRDLILSGALSSGQRIDQDSIAEILGVSRLPVREALISLEGEGMVENIPRRGAFVAPLEPSDIVDHFEMYGLLSGLAAQRAATALDEPAFNRLKATIDGMRDTDDPRIHDRLNYEFHREINRAGNSRRLAAVLRNLASSMPSHFFESSPDWGERAQSEHREIVDALEARDGTAAAAALAAHFRNVGERAVEMLAATGFWSDAEPAVSTAERAL